MDVYLFPDEVVTLGDHHKMAHRPIKVSLHLIMSYIISEVDRDVIFETQFVEENWHIITLIAEAIAPADLFSLLKKKVSTEIEQYKPLAINHLRKIRIHPNHQQRCENDDPSEIGTPHLLAARVLRSDSASAYIQWCQVTSNL